MVVRTRYPDTWRGKFVICSEYDTHGAVAVWRYKSFPKPFDTREEAQTAIDESGYPQLFPIEIGIEDYPFINEDKHNRPKVGVGVIVEKDGKVLLGKRKGSHGAGTWSLPCGHLEFYESLEGCCRREVFEETSVRVTNIRQHSFTNDLFFDEKLHYITLFFNADYESGEPTVMEREKCDEWGWFSFDDLPEPLFLPLKNLLKKP